MALYNKKLVVTHAHSLTTRCLFGMGTRLRSASHRAGLGGAHGMKNEGGNALVDAAEPRKINETREQRIQAALGGLSRLHLSNVNPGFVDAPRSQSRAPANP